MDSFGSEYEFFISDLYFLGHEYHYIQVFIEISFLVLA